LYCKDWPYICTKWNRWFLTVNAVLFRYALLNQISFHIFWQLDRCSLLLLLWKQHTHTHDPGVDVSLKSLNKFCTFQLKTKNKRTSTCTTNVLAWVSFFCALVFSRVKKNVVLFSRKLRCNKGGWLRARHWTKLLVFYRLDLLSERGKTSVGKCSRCRRRLSVRREHRDKRELIKLRLLFCKELKLLFWKQKLCFFTNIRTWFKSNYDLNHQAECYFSSGGHAIKSNNWKIFKFSINLTSLKMPIICCQLFVLKEIVIICYYSYALKVE
jgi:hypothetical protein